MKYLSDEIEITETPNFEDAYERNAQTFCAEHNVHIYVRMIDERPDDLCDGCGQPWKVCIERYGNTYHFYFSNSKAAGENPPTAYDILSCLQKYDVGSIDDFVSEYGYEVHKWADVKRIEKTYEAVKNEAVTVMLLFKDCLDELREIQ